MDNVETVFEKNVQVSSGRSLMSSDRITGHRRSAQRIYGSAGISGGSTSGRKWVTGSSAFPPLFSSTSTWPDRTSGIGAGPDFFGSSNGSVKLIEFSTMAPSNLRVLSRMGRYCRGLNPVWPEKQHSWSKQVSGFKKTCRKHNPIKIGYRHRHQKY